MVGNSFERSSRQRRRRPWGEEGHELISEIAEYRGSELLMEIANEALEQLIRDIHFFATTGTEPHFTDTEKSEGE